MSDRKRAPLDPAAWSNEDRSLALAASGLGEWSWDLATDEVVLSPPASVLFGTAPGEIATWAALRERLHPDDREGAKQAVERALAEQTDYACEYRVVSESRERWLCASGLGMYDEDGSPVGLYGVVRDSTAERLLQQVDEVARTLTEPDQITLAAARILGRALDVQRCAYAFVTEDEDTFFLTGNYTHGVSSIVGQYRFRQFSEACLCAMRAGEPWVVEDSETDARIDEEDRLAYRTTGIRGVVCVPIMKAERFVAAMAVHTSGPRRFTLAETRLVQQVASRCWESIERARVAAERERLLLAAQEANRAKDEFLAMLGHELRNPLAPIVSALTLMRGAEDAPSDRERAVIERQVAHLTRLVDDLLDVSRIARGKVMLETQAVELADAVAQAVEITSPALAPHTLQLDVSPTGLVVMADAARLAQVVTNLLTNAAKYTPPGGHIDVSARAEEEQLVLCVRDDGVGISADLLPRVFDLFTQGRQNIDRARGGLGLGLAIVRNLVELHGGSVEAHSEGLGRGTEIVVRLPRERRSGASRVSLQPPSAAPAKPSGRCLRVLVVDDNEDAGEMLALGLRRAGHLVSCADAPPEALRLAEETPFDVALLDIGLPVMDGYELAGRLRQIPHMAGAYLIAVTGYGQDGDRLRATSAGFDQHLVKPAAMAQLLELLETVASRQEARLG